MKKSGTRRPAAANGMLGTSGPDGAVHVGAAGDGAVVKIVARGRSGVSPCAVVGPASCRSFRRGREPPFPLVVVSVVARVRAVGVGRGFVTAGTGVRVADTSRAGVELGLGSAEGARGVELG